MPSPDTPSSIQRAELRGWQARNVEYENELYAERLRLKAQAEALATGAAQWTDQLDVRARVKIAHAWDDATDDLHYELQEFLESFISARTVRSIGSMLTPSAMRPDSGNKSTNDRLLSLVEAEHEGLASLDDQIRLQVMLRGGSMADYGDPAGDFQREVNRIFESHLIGLHLHNDSRLVPVDSHEMHNSVVAPVLYLLHSQPRFASAEAAYQKALKELRNRDPADAITDAATALQDVLVTLGCVGNALGPLLKSAKSKGLLRGSDTPLTESISKTVDWVSAMRGEGEAHTGKPDFDMSDAWMVVHVVGALAIRLSETDQPASESVR